MVLLQEEKKIKEVASTIGKGLGSLTPFALGREAGKALTPDTPKKDKKKGRERKKPLGGAMKNPRPGTYDYQLLQTQKPGYRVAPMLTGGQAQLDKNKNNKIDAQDFKILRAEKAGGRGMGLQDEKMKPGKVKKAVVGMLAVGMGAKKNMEKRKAPMAMGAAGVATAKLGLMKKS